MGRKKDKGSEWWNPFDELKVEILPQWGAPPLSPAKVSRDLLRHTDPGLELRKADVDSIVQRAIEMLGEPELRLTVELDIEARASSEKAEAASEFLAESWGTVKKNAGLVGEWYVYGCRVAVERVLANADKGEGDG